jgi:kynurenine formamidase
MADGRSGGVLAQLVEELNARRIRVVDLTTTLGPETPVIDLPPIFAPSPGLTLTEISRYDARGPAWYWNILTLGEHTGTHFDAPIHWVTGKDLPENATDTIAPRKFIGPACVIDVTADVRDNQDFLLTPERVQSWEMAHGLIPAGAWVLLRTGWSARTNREEFLRARRRRPLTGVLEGMLRVPGARTRRPGRRCRDRWNGRRAGRHLRSAVPQPQYDAWRRQIRHYQPDQFGPIAANRRGGHRRTAQDRRWLRQPAARHCTRTSLIDNPKAG